MALVLAAGATRLSSGIKARRMKQRRAAERCPRSLTASPLGEVRPAARAAGHLHAPRAGVQLVPQLCAGAGRRLEQDQLGARRSKSGLEARCGHV